MHERPADVIADWNRAAMPAGLPRPVTVHDETLRDGLQSPSVQQPAMEARLELLHLMSALGVDSVDLGMPFSHDTARQTVTRLAEEIRTERLPLTPVCAARTVRSDVVAVAEVAQAAGVEMSVMAFVGISPIRLYVERWEIDTIVRDISSLVAFATREGLRVCLVTEDTTRSRLDVALAVYTAALEAGAERICVCDTVGFALPWGTAELVTALRHGLAQRGFPEVGIDWHGHDDRGVAVANSLAAVAAGADRVHGTALGIGERAGNASMEQLLVNLHELGCATGDLTLLPRYCELAAESCAVVLPPTQPFIGRDVYRTATGVHAAAIRKALAMGDAWIAERVYAGVPASLLGREQTIDIGPVSGHANILHWLDRHGIEPDEAVVAVLAAAVANATRTYSDEELLAIVSATRLLPVAR